MVSTRAESPAAASPEYFTARSRTASLESAGRRRSAQAAGGSSCPGAGAAAGGSIQLAPLIGDGGAKRQIGVSCNVKRQFKDRRIYVNPRTGLPVRPPTSFGLFKHALRRSMGNKVTFLDFNRKATEQWTRMDDEQKGPYVERAKELASQFKKIEVRFLRKKVRQLQRHAKEQRAIFSSSSRSSRAPATTTGASSSSSSSRRR